MNMLFKLEIIPAELVDLGVFVACDSFINEVKQIYE
jgi:hypothetical protein